MTHSKLETAVNGQYASVPKKVTSASSSNGDRRIGLLAAWGRFPLVVAEALRRQGYHVSCLAVVGHADPKLREICSDFEWVGIAKLGKGIRFFRRCRIRQATMAGKFHKVVMYQPGIWWRHLPDWQFIKTFYHYVFTNRRDRKDDTLLGALVDAFAKQGIIFQPATNYAPELLVKSGQVAGKPPTTSQQRDIEFGWQIAKQLGALDIGQSTCVKDQAVLAVEAIEGTDACILRAGQLCRQGGFTIVKVAKPQQDMRFDVPTVGIRTLQTMVAAGARVLAIEGARTILLDDEDFCRFAARHKLSVIALDDRQSAGAAA
jgi:DUF1009 family protein